MGLARRRIKPASSTACDSAKARAFANLFHIDLETLGGIAVPEGRGISFDALLQGIHPAASRVKRRFRVTPCMGRTVG